MRLLLTLGLAASLVVGGCSREPEYRQYELQGQILAIEPAEQRVVIKHGDIKGFMPAMTMPFSVKDAALLEGKQAGDLVTATLMVGEIDAYISAITKTGSAPLEEPPDVSFSDAPVLVPGDPVPDQPLVNHQGQPTSIASLRGHRVALTFMYVRCPLPDFCPRMDRNFAEVQKTVKSTPDLADVRLVSVSFDPENDTPEALAAHAKALGADPQIWQFVTATPGEVEKLTRRFGVHVERSTENAIEITHNLRTAVIDPEGRLAVVHSGTDWTPAQLVADLQAVPAAAN